MSKNNEYKKLQSWDPKPEVQRAAEKQFYDNEPQEMRHKKKNEQVENFTLAIVVLMWYNKSNIC